MTMHVGPSWNPPVDGSARFGDKLTTQHDMVGYTHPSGRKALSSNKFMMMRGPWWFTIFTTCSIDACEVEPTGFLAAVIFAARRQALRFLRLGKRNSFAKVLATVLAT